MKEDPKNKKLVKTVAIVFNEDLLSRVNNSLEIDYEGSRSFSYVVRDLIEKGLKVTEGERRAREEKDRLYRESKQGKW